MSSHASTACSILLSGLDVLCGTRCKDTPNPRSCKKTRHGIEGRVLPAARPNGPNHSFISHVEPSTVTSSDSCIRPRLLVRRQELITRCIAWMLALASVVLRGHGHSFEDSGNDGLGFRSHGGGFILSSIPYKAPVPPHAWWKTTQTTKSRYIASKTGCRLTGVELQPDICRAGQVGGQCRKLRVYVHAQNSTCEKFGPN